jgi:hypothetical protein
MKYIFFIIAAAFLTSACTTQHTQQQRTQKPLCIETDSNSTACKNSIYIELRNNIKFGQVAPKVGFFEFNEEGNPFDQSSIDYLLDQIKLQQSNSSKPLLLVVFIHGWFHNAEQDDTNVIAFKKFISDLQKEEQQSQVGKSRSVMGIYMGWQAKASGSTVLQVLSYRSAKDLGLKTGEKSVRAVLEKLSDIRNDNKDNRMIIVGHSFGGGVLFYAVQEELQDAVSSPFKNKRKAYGDLVVLVNPAIEAEKFVELQNALSKGIYTKCSTLALASFTSKADTSLSDQFKQGMNTFYLDRVLAAKNKELVTTPYGLYSDFVKYQLYIEDGAQIEYLMTNATYSKAVTTWKNFRNGNGSFNLGGIKLSPYAVDGSAPIGNTTGYPVLNVQVSATLIKEHSDIWDQKFSYFLRGLVGMEFSKKSECEK